MMYLHGDKETIDFTPLDMVTPSTEEEVEEEVEVEKDMIYWFHERPIERSNGGLRRGFSHGNGIEVYQVQTGRTQQDRQQEE